MEKTFTSTNTTRSTLSRLHRINATILVLVAVQFLIGMLVNLFIQVPSVHPGAKAPEYFSGVVQGVAWALFNAPSWLLVHVIIGLLLFLGSIALMVFSIASLRR